MDYDLLRIIENNTFYSGDSLKLDIEIVKIESCDYSFVIYLSTDLGEKIAQFATEYDKVKLSEKSNKVSFMINRLPIIEGNFSFHVKLYLFGKLHQDLYNIIDFKVNPGDYYGIGKNLSGKGKFIMNCNWK